MPRIRTIKPEFASDEKLSSVSRDARLTFVLLVTQSDDDGLLLGRTRQLLGALYPHDESVDAEQLAFWLEELVSIGAIRWRKTVDDAPVVEICNWSKHQRVDHRAKSLLLPTLQPLGISSRESTEDQPKASRESRAPTVDRGPRTMDLRPGSVDPRARAAKVRDALPEPAKGSFDALLRAARVPDSVVAVVESLHVPLTGGHPPYPWPVIGAAIVDYAGKSPSEFSAKLLRVICADIAAAPRTPITGETERDAARRRALELNRTEEQIPA